MMSRGIKTNNESAKLGNLNTQAIDGETSNNNSKGTTNSIFVGSASPTTNDIIGTNTIVAPVSITPTLISVSDAMLLKNASSINNSLTALHNVGVSEQRPELLLCADYMPVYNDLGIELTPAGNLFEVELQSRNIKNQSVNSILEKLKQDTSALIALQSIENQFKGNWPNIQRKIDLLQAIGEQTQKIQESLQIKPILGKDSFLSVKDLLTNLLGFSNESFNSFSNSKIFHVLINELKILLERGSDRLLGLSIQDRKRDTNPISLSEQNIKVDLCKNLRSTTTTQTAFDKNFFNLFDNTFPKISDTRLKVLISLLSRELSISSALGNAQLVQLLNTNFGISSLVNGSYTDVLGTMGDKITDQNYKNNMLASVALLPISDSISVLPFENKYIDDKNNKAEYIPGSDYFTENLLVDVKNADVIAYKNYCDLISSKVTKTKQIITKTFQVDASSDYSYSGIYKQILYTIYSATNNLVEKSINTDQAIVVAIFTESRENTELRKQLFEFICLSGANDSIPEHRTIFNRVLNDAPARTVTTGINNRTLSSAGMRQLDLPNLDTLASNIEDEIFSIYGKKIIKSLQNETIQKTPSTTKSFGINLIVDGESKQHSIHKGTIKNILLGATLGSQSNLISELISYIGGLDSLLGSDSYLLPDGSGKTRYNLLSFSTLCLIIFDIYVTIINKYFYTYFVGKAESNDFIYLQLDQVAQNPVIAYCRTGIESTFKVGTVIDKQLASANNSIKSLKDINSSLTSDFNSINNILYIFDALSDKLAFSKNEAQLFFGRTNAFAILSNDEILSSLNQIRLAKSSFDVINSNINNTSLLEKYIFSDNFDTNNTNLENFILTFLSDPLLLQNKVKLFSVGIPLGLTKAIGEQVKLSDIRSSTYEQNDSNILSINVYKRSMKYPDVVFKPQKFLFDLGICGLGIPTQLDSQNLNSITLNNITFHDYQDIDNVTKYLGKDTMSKSKYNFLTNDQCTTMLKNHVFDYCLSSYIRLLTGVDLSESSFLLSNDQQLIDNSLKEQFRNLLLVYVKSYQPSLTIDDVRKTNLEIDQLLRDLDNNSLTRDSLAASSKRLGNIELSENLMEFLRLFSGNSLLVGHAITEKRILSTKIFDRIFTVPVDVTRFAVDVSTTKKTQRGIEVLNSDNFAKIIKHVGNERYISIDANDIIFDDYFVTIEAT